MRTSASSLFIASLALLAAFALTESRALADEKEACVTASDQAQTLRDEGKFHAARAQMMACARDVCPALVRHDCEKYLADLDATQPTVVLGARDPKGNDVAGVRVSLDGAALLDRLDGKPTTVDPGEHVFRYETAGAAPVEQHAIIRVGEKNRILTAILMPLAPVAARPTRLAPIASSDDAPAPPDAPSSRAGVPAASIVLASVAVAAGASFAYFGLSGRSDVSDLRATCAPNCAQSDVDAARTKLLVADVSLGVSVVSLAAAAFIYLRRGARPSTTQPSLQADVQTRPGGAVAGFTARF